MNQEEIRMRKFLIFIPPAICLIIPLLITAQNPAPEKIRSIAMLQKSHDWYVEQANLWQIEAEKKPQNADAWLNYYRSAKYARLTAGQDQQTAETLPDPETIVKDMSRHVPETFEYYYAKFHHAREPAEHHLFLEKAYELAPDRIELYPYLIVLYELQRDTVRLAEFCRKYYETNHLSPAILAWNYNMLAALEKDAILLVNGDFDSYPNWILQHAKGIRKDVAVIEVGQFSIDDFRIKIQVELNIPPFAHHESEYPDYTQFIKEYLKHLVQHSGERPLYFATTLYRDYYQHLEDHLYNEGLAFKYSMEAFDNVAVIRKNFEQVYLLDYLKIDLMNDLSQNATARFNTNYLPAFSLLYEYYISRGNSLRAVELKQLMLRIAERSANEEYMDEVRGILEKYGEEM